MTVAANWETIENAIASQVLAASGLAVGKVIWESQTPQSELGNAAVTGSGRPALPYVSLRRDLEECLSFVAEERASDNPSGYAGVAAGSDTITNAIDPDGTPGIVAVDHLSQWGAVGTTGTGTLDVQQYAETIVWIVTSTGLSLATWPTKAHRQHAAITRDTVVGTELLAEHDTPSEFHLRIQVYTTEVRGNSSATALMSSIHNYFDTHASKDALRAAGVAIIEKGVITNLSGLIDTRIEGRASLDLRLRIADGITEVLTYISSVTYTPTINNVAGSPVTITE